VLRASGRTYQRTIRKPNRFNDAAPSPKRRRRRFQDEPLPPPPVILPEEPTEEETGPEVHVAPKFTTQKTSYGIFRVYPAGRPTWTPNELHRTDTTIEDFEFAFTIPLKPTMPTKASAPKYFEPFKNASTFRMMNWYQSGSSSKTAAEVDRLVHEVILADDFKKEDLVGFRASKETEILNNNKKDANSHFTAKDGWKQGSVTISLPSDHARYKSEEDAPKFTIDGIFHKDLLEVTKSALQDSSGEQFHYAAYQEFWQPEPDHPPERIFSEVYSADAFILEDTKIRTQYASPTMPTIETVVCAFLLYSDATHLTSFGSASLWPIYVFFGNLTKYFRAKASSFAAHHLAYIPKVCFIFIVI
jgi:hypothetical protein